MMMMIGCVPCKTYQLNPASTLLVKEMHCMDLSPFILLLFNKSLANRFLVVVEWKVTYCSSIHSHCLFWRLMCWNCFFVSNFHVCVCHSVFVFVLVWRWFHCHKEVEFWNGVKALFQWVNIWLVPMELIRDTSLMTGKLLTVVGGCR